MPFPYSLGENVIVWNESIKHWMTSLTKCNLLLLKDLIKYSNIIIKSSFSQKGKHNSNILLKILLYLSSFDDTFNKYNNSLYFNNIEIFPLFTLYYKYINFRKFST